MPSPMRGEEKALAKAALTQFENPAPCVVMRRGLASAYPTWRAAVRLATLLSAILIFPGALALGSSALHAQAMPAEEHAAAAVRRVGSAMAATNRYWCPSDTRPCQLDLRLGIPDAIQVFYADKAIWLSTQNVQMTRNDAELALLIGHEWAHVLLSHNRGFDEGQELAADCVGALIAGRSGYDPREGVNLYVHLAAWPDMTETIRDLLGLGGGATNLDWNRRIAVINRAGAQAAGKPVERTDVARICGVKL